MSSAFVAAMLPNRGDLAWRDRAACAPERLPAQVRAADFFAGTMQKARTRATNEAIARAKALCSACPVQSDCRAYIAAMPGTDRFGVWAGQYFTQKHKKVD